MSTFGLAAHVLAIGGCIAPVEEPENVVRDIDDEACSLDSLAGVGVLDVAVAIDNSLSTHNPSGADLDDDGIVGGVYQSRFTDRDDSRLKAEIAAVRRLVRLAESADVRFSIISYSGPGSTPTKVQPERIVWNKDARIHADLTDDVPQLLSTLAELEDRGSRGTSNFVAGLRRAIRSLIEATDRESRKLILFISDSPRPVLREMDGRDTRKDVRLQRVAREALEERIVVNTFGLSEEAHAWRLEPLGRIAGATGGDYHVVDDPMRLYCHLAGSLVTASGTP